jgi:hypothetical protein
MVRMPNLTAYIVAMLESAGRFLVSVACLCLFAGEAPAQDTTPAGLPDYIQEASRPYRGPPSADEVTELLARWRADGGLTEPMDRLVGARLWRRAGDARRALSLLTGLPESGPVVALARYERARILFELGDERETGWAPRDWDAACNAIADLPTDEATQVRSEFWADLGVLSTGEERDTWPDVPDEAACDWLRDLVAERAFRMAITPDERLALHHRRLVEARENFWLKRPRFYVSMSDLHGRRKGEWMDDRGLIYLRMGMPDTRLACGGTDTHEEAVFSENSDGVGLLGVCWVYNRTEGYKIFYFSTVNRVTGTWSADGDFRLQESLGPRAHPGNGFFQTFVRNADLPESVIRELIRGGRRGINLGGDQFYRSLNAAQSRAGSLRMQVALRDQADEVLREVPDVPAVTGADIQWETLRFLDPDAGTWTVWVLAAIPAGQLQPSRDGARWVYSVRATLATRHADGIRLDSLDAGATLYEELDPDSGIPLRMMINAEEGSVPLTLEVADRNQEGVGAWVQDTLIIPRRLPLPMLSDIAVAQLKGGSWTRDGTNFLRVTPSHVTNGDGSIHVYFEVYGVRRSGTYQVEIRMAKDKTGEEIFGEDAEDVPYLLQFGAEMPNSGVGRHALRLDLSDTDPDLYALAIRVVDGTTGTRSLPAVTPIRVAR